MNMTKPSIIGIDFQIPETKKLIEELTYMRTHIYPEYYTILIEELSKVIKNLSCTWNNISNTLSVKVDPQFITETNMLHDITNYYPMIQQIVQNFLRSVRPLFSGAYTANHSGIPVPMFDDIISNPLKIVLSISAILSDTLIICL